jgi:hypothetical protein
MGYGFMRGVGTAFSTGASNALANGAIVQTETALHISVNSEMDASVSTQIAALRNLLFSKSAEGSWDRVQHVSLPHFLLLVFNVDTGNSRERSRW